MKRWFSPNPFPRNLKTPFGCAYGASLMTRLRDLFANLRRFRVGARLTAGAVNFCGTGNACFIVGSSFAVRKDRRPLSLRTLR